MDSITSNVQISRLRDGTLLLKSIDRQQAEKLTKQTMLGGEIGIKIIEHPNLNLSRGTIYCPDLIALTDEEILENLRDSRVVSLKRVKRKISQEVSKDTGAFILTFDLTQIPTTMDVGFYKCRVRQYIPSPLRCANCLKFGHVEDKCRGNKVCSDCAQLYYDESPCKSKVVCVNCRQDHNSWSKKCQIYEDEFEIQRIRITERISMREARRKRRSQVPAPVFATVTSNRTFSKVTQENLPVSNEQCRTPFIKNTTVQQLTEIQAIPSSLSLDKLKTPLREKQQMNTHNHRGKSGEIVTTLRDAESNNTPKNTDDNHPTITTTLTSREINTGTNNNIEEVSDEQRKKTDNNQHYEHSEFDTLSQAVHTSIFVNENL